MEPAYVPTRVLLAPHEIDDTLSYMYYVAVQHHYLQTTPPPPHHQFIERVCNKHPLAVACFSIGFHCAFVRDTYVLRSFLVRVNEILEVGTMGEELNREMAATVRLLTGKIWKIIWGE